ncbi:14-3-3-like protein [Cladophialophora carrionii]|uniref:14-3-3-like protein n=1 Tax=Cladophialophora carrionii TaxID=86049 RepID=A0A1C1CU46_9EURO|nr:14-3-3-like protein [Cladophialophora carrionii]
MDTDSDTDNDDAGMSELSPPSSALRRWKQGFVELTYLSRQWQPSSRDQSDPPLYSIWMASSEVDQKFLGYFAKVTTTENNYLSSFLFRVLGLSVILAEKLLRARRAKRLDPVRDPKARQLIHHILWLAREGLVMVEQYVLPMVGNYVELKVLSFKLKASFYHIFVLFHNEPPVNDRINRSRSFGGGDGSFTLFPEPLSPRESREGRERSSRQGTLRSPTEGNGTRRRSPAISTGRVMGATTTRTPPGLPLPATYPYFASGANGNGNGTATFLLPLQDYTPIATQAFREANELAESLLPGSHPVRLSVKVEYVAYVYDCLHEAEASRRMAKMSIRHVYEAQEGMDDDSFEDAAEMVGILGRMMKRGLGPGGSSGSQVKADGQSAGGRREQAQQPSTWV